ncbi:MAG: hypothetical protein AAF604_24565 [Acidobacteriota bacterium]
MAVFERTLRPFEGALTAPRWRFLVLSRYARQQVFQSRLLTGFFALCFAPFVFATLVVYLRYNLPALEAFNIDAGGLPPIDQTFFFYFLRLQGFLAFLLTAFIGPGLIAPDLANNALPLYLSRPFSRFDYVLGKLTVLFVLLSAVTWLPVGLAWFLNGTLRPESWSAEYLGTGFAIFVGSWVWILILALLAVAFSAWLKWKILAGTALFATFFVAGALGEATNQIFDTRWGDLINLGNVITRIWDGLFFSTSTGSIPLWSAWVSLALICAFCLWILNRKLRAYEVIS